MCMGCKSTHGASAKMRFRHVPRRAKMYTEFQNEHGASTRLLFRISLRAHNRLAVSTLDQPYASICVFLLLQGPRCIHALHALRIYCAKTEMSVLSRPYARSSRGASLEVPILPHIATATNTPGKCTSTIWTRPNVRFPSYLLCACERNVQ